ncbi:MAG: ribosome maturation factor RimM [Dehalococcoidales bacterium]|jgi:16S rRNA processing protein RimM|nr:16S rRNA processing protein RimM [Marinobacter sp.]MDP6632609.1 ribosome maturation factor RimM [Dehalococcoidales bacterium]MDP7525329.1 ribosome maturation factor RimM [Dehalococcoidales bacterium]
MKPSELKFITIGKVLAPWRLEGHLKIEVITDFPQRFASSSTVYIDRQPATIESITWHKGRAIVRLNTVDNLQEAEKLKGKLVEIHHSQLRSLSDGQYYHFELIGLRVQTTQGEFVGKIKEVLTTTNNDTYVVNGPGGEILIPAVGDIVKSVDLSKGYLVIEPIKGLLNLNKKEAKPA